MDAADDSMELVQDFASWATRKSRHPDLDLLSTFLDLRASYDDLAPTYWPAGCIEDLLLDLWPAKGPTEAPDAEVTVETLDSFARFLRSTGRMSSRSAEPSILAKEARRAARAMSSVAGDPVNWSPTKVMMHFGRGMGIDVQGAPDLESAQLRLRQIQELWNDLPIDERHRLMPMAGDSPPRAMSGREAAMEKWAIDDPTVALIMTFRDRLPSGRLPEDGQIAPYFSQSSFSRQLLALAEWVGDGREITGTGVLRPAEAKQAYAALGLGAWQRRLVELEYPDERLPGVAKLGRDAWIERELTLSWRSAGEVVELHRLWLGATGAGLVRVDGKRAVSPGERDLDVTRWVEVGIRSVVAAMSDVLRRPGNRVALVWSLLESYVTGGRPVPRAEALDFQDSWHFAPGELQSDDSTRRAWGEPGVDAALAQLDDTGIYTYDEGALRLTPAGDVFVTAWLKYMESWNG